MAIKTFHLRGDDTLADYFTRELAASDGAVSRRVVAVAAYINAAYLAIEHTVIASGQQQVGAVVASIRHYPGHRDNLGYELRFESGNPRAAACPERILDLLSPTREPAAREWRLRCRDHLAKLAAVPPLKAGDVLSFAAPIRFRDKSSERSFRVTDARRRLVTTIFNKNYRLSKRLLLKVENYRIVRNGEVVHCGSNCFDPGSSATQL